MLGELLTDGSDCRAATDAPVCIFTVRGGAPVLAPFDGKLVVTTAPGPHTAGGGLSASPYAAMFETVYYARDSKSHPTLYLGPMRATQQPGLEVSFKRGEVIGITLSDELFASLWYSDGACRRELFRDHPGDWPRVLPRGDGSGGPSTCSPAPPRVLQQSNPDP